MFVDKAWKFWFELFWVLVFGGVWLGARLGNSRGFKYILLRLNTLV